jgi:Fe-S-cluster-containing dehydrogenase component/CRP-like cAMP-binding protein
MPQENTKRRDVLAAIESVGAIADLASKHDGHYEYEIDLEVIVYGRNYNGKQVGPYVRLLNYAPGEEIVREGEWGGNTFYIVVAGQAEVFGQTPQGRAKVAEIPSGVQFGEMSVLAGTQRNATVRAPREQAIQVLEVQRPALRLLRKLPRFGETLDAAYRKHGRANMIQEITKITELSPEAIRQLESISKFRVYAKNHALFRAGELANRLFVLKSGWARLSSRTPVTNIANGIANGVEGGNGRGAGRNWNAKAEEAYIGPSHCFGVDAITRDGEWEFTCTLMERSEVLEISISKLRQQPELRETLLLAFSGMSIPNESQAWLESREPTPVAKAQEELIETGLVDATNLLVMDMDLCVRCGNCSMACHQIHGQSRLVRRGIHIDRPVSIKKNSSYQSLLAPAVCLHCKEAECLTGCPTGAIARFPDGQVDIDAKSCIGCADCATQCPYNAISMIPRKAKGAPIAKGEKGKNGDKANGTPAAWKRWLRLATEPLPPAVDQTDDLLAVKCNLCAGTSLNPDGVKRPAFSCEESCPTGALLRVDPRSYFAEIKNIEGVVFKGPTQAIARHTSHKDAGKRLTHAIGIILTLLSIGLTIQGMFRYGLEVPLIGSWFDLRWLTGIVGLIGIAGVMTYPVRKQIYKRRAGPLRYWMLGHSYLGVIAGAILLLHGGSDSGGALTTALMISFDLVILTGLFGILCYFVAPRMLTKIEGQPLLIEDLLARREELSEELGATMAAASPEAQKLIRKLVLKRCLSLPFLVRQYLRTESLEQIINAVNRELKPTAASLSAYERGNFFSAVEKAVTMRRVDALIYLHQSLKLWLAPHVIATSLMLALMLVHIVQVLYFLAR